ncbi:MAG: hypothetical protein Q9186_004689 [Xanthomendoza sp. 1 TL-2023]
MHSYIQFLSTPTADTAGTALILDVGKQRYLFGNVHEGLQRTCIQRNASLFKTSEVFITGKTEWKNVGGLFGLILTLADANSQAIISETDTARLKKEAATPEQLAAKAQRSLQYQIKRKQALRQAGLDPDEHAQDDVAKQQLTLPTLTIHGGENLTHTIATGRRFIFRKGMPVEIVEHTEAREQEFPSDGRDPDWTDDFIQVWKLPIEPFVKPIVSDISPESPRKRSFDEFAGADLPSPRNEAASINHSYTAEDLKAKDQETRKFVVTEMFNSQWRLDTLFETPLREVDLPAMLWFRDKETHKLERYYPPQDAPLPNIKVLVRRPWPGALVERLPDTKPSEIAMSYIVRHYPQKGKFKPQKAKELNIHHLVWSALQNGATVKSPDGVTVTPEMVLEPTRKGGGFAVVDVSTKDHLTTLLNRPEWKMTRIMDGLQAMVWNLGSGLASDPSLQSFIQQHSELKHLISAPDVSPNYITFDSSAALVIRLNQIDSARYQIPIHSNISPIASSSEQTHGCIDARHSNAIRDFKLQLVPQLQIQEPPNKQPFLDTRKVLQLTPKEVLELAETARGDVASGRLMEKLTGQNLPSQDAEVICLGTGSSVPSKYRNVSATLLRVPGCGSYLFDCGEGTLGQLRRLYNPAELEEVLRDLKAIWISHMHADHHLGTASVIKAWREANHGPSRRVLSLDSPRRKPTNLCEAIQQEKKLFLFGGRQMTRWLEEYSSVEDYGYDKVIAINTLSATLTDPTVSLMYWNGTQVGFCTQDPAMNRAMMDATGIKNLVSCFVDHCLGSQAVNLRFHTGFGFSYSGDCRPSKQFVRIGKGSTVLVHEATFDDDMQSDAKAKKHSTMSEAIGVALAMGAKRLILTHFSQRYHKLPNLGALDNMNLKFDDPVEPNDSAQESDIPTDSGAMDMSTETSDPPKDESISTPTQTLGWPSAFASSSNSIPSPDKHQLKIAIAFDFLRVRVGDIAYIEKFTPTLQRMFELLDQKVKVKAKDNAGEVARRKKEEQKEEKREKLKKMEQENREMKLRKKDSSQRLRRDRDSVKEQRNGEDLTQDTRSGERNGERQSSSPSHERVTREMHKDGTGFVRRDAAGPGRRSPSPASQLRSGSAEM